MRAARVLAEAVAASVDTFSGAATAPSYFAFHTTMPTRGANMVLSSSDMLPLDWSHSRINVLHSDNVLNKVC